ncbi:MAG: hypothetical protein AAF479_05730 [Pseudomonadota bacterium]
MLDPVVITLSLIAALTCFLFYIATNRDFRAYVFDRDEADEVVEAQETVADGECR